MVCWIRLLVSAATFPTNLREQQDLFVFSRYNCIDFLGYMDAVVECMRWPCCWMGFSLLLVFSCKLLEVGDDLIDVLFAMYDIVPGPDIGCSLFFLYFTDDEDVVVLGEL